jgi:preprotein translocase subunit SecG
MYALMVVLTIVYVVACLFLCFVVLIQKGEGGGLGGAFGGGAVDVAFGAKADMTWKRATAVCATIFMVLAMFLGVLHDRLDKRSIAAEAERRAEEQRQQELKGKTSTETGTPKPLETPGLPKTTSEQGPTPTTSDAPPSTPTTEQGATPPATTAPGDQPGH